MPNPKARPCEEAAIHAVAPAFGCTAAAKRWVLAVTILASTISYIDESVVNVALPRIEAELQTSAEVVQWLVNAYMLSLAALLLIGGASGDRFGRRRVFVLGTGIFAAASVWCGLSPNVGQLIAARGVQGAGAALLIPCSLAIIGATFDESERGRAIGTWAGFSAISAAFGPLLGGFIVDHVSWRWIFLINPFVAVPTIWIALAHVPESRDEDAKGALDWRGSALVFAGLGSLVFGLIALPTAGAANPYVWATLAAAVVLLTAFVWEETRSVAPMMPPKLFASRMFSGINILTVLLYAALGGAFFFLPFALIQVHGASATLAGSMFLPFTIVMAALSRWSGGLLDRFGARLPLIVGPAIAALAFALLALPRTDGSIWVDFAPAMIVLGLGMAVTVAPLTTSVINAVPTHQAGVASGINNAVASVASLLAVAILGAVALASYNHALEVSAAAQPSAVVRDAVLAARGAFAAEPPQLSGTEREAATAIVKQSLAGAIRLVMLLAAGLALASAVCAALTIDPRRKTKPAPSGKPVPTG